MDVSVFLYVYQVVRIMIDLDLFHIQEQVYMCAFALRNNSIFLCTFVFTCKPKMYLFSCFHWFLLHPLKMLLPRYTYTNTCTHTFVYVQTHQLTNTNTYLEC